MRFILVGLLNLTLVGIAGGQAVGDVESIGFGRSYRPNAWTPMVVRLTPTTATPFHGKIQVVQEDLDKDRVLFTRTIDLGGNAQGGGEKTQRYWMYFIPQPKLYESANDLADLNKYKLQVFLCTESGKQLVQLPVKDAINDLELRGSDRTTRSSKLVLYVTEQSKPVFSPYGSDAGVKEDVATVQIPIASVRNLLPESVLGYESVDTVVWFDADPTLLSADQRAALEKWVRGGGKFVVCQTGKPNLWEIVRREFAALLPVTVSGIDQAADITALKRIVDDRFTRSVLPAADKPLWPSAKAPFPIARAVAKPGALVEEIFDNRRKKDDEPYADTTPWLVRGAYGYGQVTWVAQDLGDVSVTGSGREADGKEDYKWAYVWDRVFDWPNDSQSGRAGGGEQSRYHAKYAPRPNEYRLGGGFSQAMDFSDKGVGYLGLAVVFFIVYWVVAGPGGYLFLAARKKAGYSWLVFGLTAVVATGLTVLIVKIALRGAPELHHATFVRTAPDEPTVAYSDIGLYVPRDGEQKVELKGALPDVGSYLTAYPDVEATGGGFNDHADYEVNTSDPTAASFRYRSTLKKLQARWIGRTGLGFEGSAKLGPNLSITGFLTNKTGRDLHNLCVVFYYPSDSIQNRGTWLLYLPSMKKDASPIDLSVTFGKAPLIDRDQGRIPGGEYVVRGKLAAAGAQRGNWDGYWYESIKRDATSPNDQRDFPMLGVYDRLPVWAIVDFATEHTRYDLHRPILRGLDASAAIGAGKLVVMGTSDSGPVPIPIEVEGEKVEGAGITYYQSILPLDGSDLAIQPTTRPTTERSGVREGREQ